MASWSGDPGEMPLAELWRRIDANRENEPQLRCERLAQEAHFQAWLDATPPVSMREVAVCRGLDLLTGALACGALAAMVDQRSAWFLTFGTLGVLAQVFRAAVVDDLAR